MLGIAPLFTRIHVLKFGFELVLQKNAKVVSIDGYEDVPPYNEKALKKAVAHQPVSVAIEASGREFQLYLSVIRILLLLCLISCLYGQ